MAKFRFTLEDKNIIDENSNKIEIIGHRINEGGGKGKFIKALAYDIPDRPLKTDCQYEAQWKKQGDEWWLVNFDPIIVDDDDINNPLIDRATQSPIKKAAEFIPDAVPRSDNIPTYDEAKANVLRAIGEFLDLCYRDYHLGIGRK